MCPELAPTGFSYRPLLSGEARGGGFHSVVDPLALTFSPRAGGPTNAVVNAAILPTIVGLIPLIFELPPPGHMFPIPRHGAGEPFRQRDPRSPAQLRRQLLAAQRIAADVRRPNFDKTNPLLR